MGSDGLRVALACSGLGHVRRGFEVFTEDLFGHLADSVDLRVTLYRGAGPEDSGQVPLWNIPRESPIWRVAGGRIDPYIGEQITFAIDLARHLKRSDADIVYLSDGQVGSALLRLLPGDSRKFRLILSNGGPLSPIHCRQFDYIQQVNPVEFDRALAHGLGEDRMTLLPYGIDSSHFSPPKSEGIRNDLGIPVGKTVLLTVGAHGAHKRLEFLIRGAALVKEGIHFLVVGEEASRSRSRLRILAKELLGEHVTFLSLPRSAMPSVYRAADVYIHGALREGCSLAILEAMAMSLPVVHHDEPGMNWVIGGGGPSVDMTDFDRFLEVLSVLLEDPSQRNRFGRRARVRVESEFSWPVLLPRYLEMFHDARRAEQLEVS